MGEALRRARRSSPAALHGNDLPVFRSTFMQAEYQEVVHRDPRILLRRRHLPGQPGQRLDLCYALPSLHLYHTLRTVNPSARSPATSTSATTS